MGLLVALAWNFVFVQFHEILFPPGTWTFNFSDYLIASIQASISDSDLIQLRDNLVEQVGRFRARGVIVDVTVLDVMDSFAVRTLSNLSHMIMLRGAKTVIVGIQPEVAFAMVQLGLTLSGVNTALDLEEGLAYLNIRAKRSERSGH
jgi:rsbT antagonist protein RsbS